MRREERMGQSFHYSRCLIEQDTNHVNLKSDATWLIGLIEMSSYAITLNCMIPTNNKKI